MGRNLVTGGMSPNETPRPWPLPFPMPLTHRELSRNPLTSDLTVLHKPTKQIKTDVIQSNHKVKSLQL